MKKLLVVEDSSDAFNLINRALGRNYTLIWARTQREASNFLNAHDIDLILLDVTLPDGDGLQLCSLLQTHSSLCDVPVILLTARNTVSDKVMAFSLGADDFVTKPFDALELKARVDSRLRRREAIKHASDITCISGIEIDRRTQRVSLKENGTATELELTPIEFKILSFLAGRPNVVVSRDEILDAVWGQNVHVYSRSVDTHVSKLRRKLGTKASYIASVHGTGYRLVMNPEEQSAKRLFDHSFVNPDKMLTLGLSAG